MKRVVLFGKNGLYWLLQNGDWGEIALNNFVMSYFFTNIVESY